MAPAQKFQWLFAVLMGSAMVFGVTFAVSASCIYNLCHFLLRFSRICF